MSDFGEHWKNETRTAGAVGIPRGFARLEPKRQHAVAKHTGGEAIVVRHNAVRRPDRMMRECRDDQGKAADDVRMERMQ
jgi:hypothetical protein